MENNNNGNRHFESVEAFEATLTPDKLRERREFLAQHNAKPTVTRGLTESVRARVFAAGRELGTPVSQIVESFRFDEGCRITGQE